MTSKCRYCGKHFKTVKGMRIHEATCPYRDKRTQMEKAEDNMKEAQRNAERML